MEPKLFIDLVSSMKGQMTVTELCGLFKIPRSTYYRWLKNKKLGDLSSLELEIQKLCLENKYRYGYRKITALLNRKRKVSKNTVQRIMQKHNWNCRVKVKRRKKIRQPFRVVENKLNHQFNSDEPFQKLVTDITYLPFGRKQLYLSSIMDLYNGEIIAYTIGEKQDINFVLDTLEQLPEVTNCLLHSDQGSVSTSYRIVPFLSKA